MNLLLRKWLRKIGIYNIGIEPRRLTSMGFLFVIG